MRKLPGLFFFLVVIALIFFITKDTFIYRYMKVSQITPPGLTPTPISSQTTTTPRVTVNGQSYAYAYIFVSDKTKLELIANFSDTLDSQTIAHTNNCTQAINGGFYDKQNNPLGLFITDGKIIEQQISSALFNGFLTVDTNGTAYIDTNIHASARIAVQSGPLLMPPLHIKNDTHARRMVAGKTTQGNLIFLTVYDGEAVYSGPLLGDLPELISAVNRQEYLRITDAINLDGGSASAFYNGQTNLSELTPVGSLFCVK